MMHPKKFLYLGVLSLFLAGCEGTVRNHGFMPFAEDVDALIIGVDTRESVLDQLGSPSTGSVNEDGPIVYVRSRVEHKGYARPAETNRDLLVLSFGPDNVLKNVERVGIEEGQVVSYDPRVTDTITEGQGALAQILGSIGGFNPASVIGSE